jgi:BolA protein
MTHSNEKPVQQRIETKLLKAFEPEFFQVIDESAMHSGHSGHTGHANEGQETHFRVRLVSRKFIGMSRVDRHRAINGLLAEELAGGVHALALEIKAPGE